MLHIIDPAKAAPVPVREQIRTFGAPLWRLSAITPAGVEVCLVCCARTSYAVDILARRSLKDYTGFRVGRYLGACPPRPHPRRTLRVTQGAT
jgi:phosphoglycolate phosphatase-like HAD superfamily hydrolase